MTPDQRRTLFALFKHHGITEAQEQRNLLSRILLRHVASRASLTSEEAHAAISHLAAIQTWPVGDREAEIGNLTRAIENTWSTAS